MLKKSVFCLLASVLCLPAFAQTNVFPSDGNVGIGTTTPQWTLDVVGAAMGIRSDNGNATNLLIKNTRPGGREWGLVTWGDQSGGGAALTGKFTIYDNTAGGHRLVIGSDGNVGIGTISPSYKLAVAGQEMGLTYTGSADAGIRITDANRAWKIGTNLFGAGIGKFGVFDGTAYAIRFTIDTSGNIGIGTSNPSHKLEVNGDTRLGAGVDYGTATVLSVAPGTIGFDAPGVSGGRLKIDGATGNVGIGTTTPSHKLAVNGTVRAKEVIVDTGWADYVFKKGYRLAPLTEVEAHIEREGHLPGIPSAAEVEAGGVSLGDMQAKLLAKVEELTLHIIALEKRMRMLEAENTVLRANQP